MEQFLKDIGLEFAIEIFTGQRVKMEHLPYLTDDEIKELLPFVGDRVTLKTAIKNLQQPKDDSEPQRKKKRTSLTKMTVIKQIKNDPAKKAVIIRLLNTDNQRIAELYMLATEILIKYSLFSFDDGCGDASSDWRLINFSNGSLNCPLCGTEIVPQLRKTGNVFWNVTNFDRHFSQKHYNAKNTNVDVNSYLEIQMTAGTAMEIEGQEGTDNSIDPMIDAQTDRTETDEEQLAKNETSEVITQRLDEAKNHEPEDAVVEVQLLIEENSERLKNQCRANDMRNQKKLCKLWRQPNVREEVKKSLEANYGADHESLINGWDQDAPKGNHMPLNDGLVSQKVNDSSQLRTRNRPRHNVASRKKMNVRSGRKSMRLGRKHKYRNTRSKGPASVAGNLVFAWVSLNGYPSRPAFIHPPDNGSEKKATEEKPRAYLNALKEFNLRFGTKYE